MNLTHARLIHGLMVGVFAAALLVAFGAMQAVPVHAAGPLAAADSPAPDTGDDSSDGGSDPTEQPSPEPTTEPSESATPTAGTDDTTSESNNDDSDANTDESSDSGDGGSASGTDSSTGVGTGFASGGSADGTGPNADSTKADPHTMEPAESGWSSSLGWVLLVGGLASMGGAFAVYRHDPSVFNLPRLRHAH